jgi:hypothetical protein
MKQQEDASCKIKNSSSESSQCHEAILKVDVQMSDTAGFVGLGRIVNKKMSTGFLPVARGILFKDSAHRLLHI